MKRLLSIIITCTLIFSMLPAIYADAADEVYTLKYEFNPNNYTTTDVPQVTEATYEDTYGQWVYHSKQSSDERVQWYLTPGLNLQASAVGDWYAFKLNVPVAGNYTVKYNYGGYNTLAGSGKVVFLPGNTTDIAAALESEDKILLQSGEYNYDTASGINLSGALNVSEIGTLNIETPGEYFVVFQVTAVNAKNTSWARMHPYAITLTTDKTATASTAVPMYIKATINGEETAHLVAGNTASISVSGYFSDKSEVSSTNGTIAYELVSGAEYVDLDTNTGAVTAKAVGSAVVKVSFTSGGVTVSDTIAIAVEGKPYQFEYSFYNSAVKNTATAKYSDTYGKFAYYAKQNVSTANQYNKGVLIGITQAGGWFAYKINVPVSGTYDIKYDFFANPTNGDTNASVYLLDGNTNASDIPAAMETATPIFTNINYYSSSNRSLTCNDKYLAAGEYLLVFKSIGPANGANAAKYPYAYPEFFTLTNRALADDESYCTVPMYLDAAVAEIKVDEAADISLTGWLSDGSAITFDSGIVTAASESANVRVADGKVTGVRAGTADIKVTATKDGVTITDTVSVTVLPKEDGALTEAFDYEETTFTEGTLLTATVNTFTAKLGESKTSADTDVTIDRETVSLGESHTVTAPAPEDGYKFLYWAKGLTTEKKQVVSYEERYSFVPTVENTFLIAVYAPTGDSETAAKAEFYNGNGQLLESKVTATFPTTEPTMAGCGEFKGWKCFNDGVLYTGSEVFELDGTMIFVAQYEDADPIRVTVTNGSCDKAEYAYGDLVTLTPNGTGTFKCWEKDGAIVSTEKDYSFFAWEDCEVKAIFADETYAYTGKAAKILIDVLDGTNFVMAEFIDLDKYGKAVECGIMIGNKRYAMTGFGKSQFVLDAENAADAASAVGYAIFNDGKMITDK